MKLSIIVPVHNTERYLPECINSLVNQTYRNKEIILVDNGSTDLSGDICDRYAGLYDCIRVVHQENQGVQGARNTGLKYAAGELIALVDSDDGIDYDFYEILISELIKTQSDMAACGFTTEYSGNLHICEKHKEKPESILIRGKDACLSSIHSKESNISGFVWNKVFKKEKVQGLTFCKEIEIVDDLFFVYEAVVRVETIVYVPLPMYHYRYVESGATQKVDIPRMEACLKSLKYINGWVSQNASCCEVGAHTNYIFWNTKTCEMMLRDFHKDVYRKIKNELKMERKYIPYCKMRIRLLAKCIMKSWEIYKLAGGFIWGLKKCYIKVKKRGL